MSPRASRVTALVALCAAFAAVLGIAAPRPRVLVRERVTRTAVRLGSQRPDGAIVHPIDPHEGQAPALRATNQGHKNSTVVSAGEGSRTFPVARDSVAPSAPAVSARVADAACTSILAVGTGSAPSRGRAPPSV